MNELGRVYDKVYDYENKLLIKGSSMIEELLKKSSTSII